MRDSARAVSGSHAALVGARELASKLVLREQSAPSVR
jgi:hypothetical protein